MAGTGLDRLIEQGWSDYFEAVAALVMFEKAIQDAAKNVLSKYKHDLESAMGLELQGPEKYRWPGHLDTLRSGVTLGAQCRVPGVEETALYCTCWRDRTGEFPPQVSVGLHHLPREAYSELAKRNLGDEYLQNDNTSVSVRQNYNPPKPLADMFATQVGEWLSFVRRLNGPRFFQELLLPVRQQ